MCYLAALTADSAAPRFLLRQVDEALKELQTSKGPGCCARLASKSDQAELAPSILRLRMEMQQAVEEERCAVRRGAGPGPCAVHACKCVTGAWSLGRDGVRRPAGWAGTKMRGLSRLDEQAHNGG